MLTIFNRKYDLKSFHRRRTPKIDDHFGVYFICGKQGSGKTYEAVRLLKSLTDYNKIITNIHSLQIPHEDFNCIDDIVLHTEENCVFVIDEVSRKYDRNSRTDKQFYAWLNQSRKRRRIVILITQEWRELPMWLRRPAKYMFAVERTIFTKPFNIYRTAVSDAENMIFDKDEGEYTCPLLYYIYHKRNVKTARLYDTFEPINEL